MFVNYVILLYISKYANWTLYNVGDKKWKIEKKIEKKWKIWKIEKNEKKNHEPCLMLIIHNTRFV